MSNVKKLDPTALRMIRPQIDAGLKELGDKLGIKFHAGNARCDGLTGNYKLEMTLVGDIEGKSPQEIEEARLKTEFENYAALFGLKVTDFLREVNVNGETFALVGLNPKAPKNSYLGRNAKGTVYRLPSSMVEPQLKAG